MWAQLGYAYELSAGAVEGGMLVAMDLCFKQCAEVGGSVRLNVPPSLTAASSAGSTIEALVVPVGAFVSRAGLEALKAGIVSRSAMNADMESMLVYRTALNQATAGAWQFTLEAKWHTVPTGTAERCTSQLAPSFKSDVLVQPGFAVRRRVGGAQVRGDFEVAVLVCR